MKRITGFLAARSPVTIAIACVVVAIGAGFGDYFTGVEVSSALFYLLPVLVATWYVGTGFAVALSVLSAASLVIGDAIWGFGSVHPAIIGWNVVVPLGFYVVFIAVLERLKASLRREQELSRTDALTGLFNRRHFDELAELERERSKRYGHPFGLAYLDLDNFKEVNDTYGHETGDELLVTAARLMRSSLRENDVVGRLGGDEFAFLLPEASPEACAMVAFRLKGVLVDAMKAKGWPVTASIGLAAFLEPPESVDAMLAEADRLMYAVKEAGKDSIDMVVVGLPA